MDDSNEHIAIKDDDATQSENEVVEDDVESCKTTTIENSTEHGEEDEDEDDVEPKLTYDRVGNDVLNILKTDSASCLTLYERFFALGTQQGRIYIFDFQGNFGSNRQIGSHRTTINQISIDEKGEYVASCSDYRITITELYTKDSAYVANFDRPVKTICLDPNYASSSSKRFAIGEADRFLLFEKNLLGRYKNSCLQQARGVIRTSSWRTQFIAWASDLCVKIYDAQGRCIITHIDREKEADYRIKSDLFQCSFCWKDNLTLLIAWGNSVKMCCIKPKTHESELSLTNISNSDRTPKFYVELVYAFNIEDSLIACGIAPFESRIMIICTNKTILCPKIGDHPSDTKQICRIKLVEPLNADLFNDISDDILCPREFLKTVTNSRDIGMAFLPGENFYFIICPKDLIVAKPREEDDHINWLMERGKYVDALARVRSNGVRKCYKHTVESVGTLFIQHLFSQGNVSSFEEAAKLCSTICGTSKPLWEREVIRFKQVGCLRIISHYLPIGPDIILDPALYELVLSEFLETDSLGYLNLIREWPPNLYSTTTLIKATIDKLSSQSQDRNLLEALAELYSYECLYRKALFIFLQVGNSKKVFELIYSHQLLHLLEDRIVQLLQLDPEETSRLLIMHQESIPSDKVISRLNDHPRLLCAYLDRLIHRDPTTCASYHNLLFDLYSTYEPEKLVPLLRQSNYIQLDKALEVCKKKNLTNAIVFIQGRMGKTMEALRIIIEKMNDINAAIEFCKEHGDSDLWAELMDISVSGDNPQLLSTLLREVSTYAADPIGLISRIPQGHKVPDLMPSLVKILQDYRLQVTLEDGCCRVLHSDCYNLLSKIYRTRSRAISVRTNTLCQCCQRTVLEYDPLYANDLVLFQCGHVFHQHCLLTLDNQNTVCTVCRTQKKHQLSV